MIRGESVAAAGTPQVVQVVHPVTQYHFHDDEDDHDDDHHDDDGNYGYH